MYDHQEDAARPATEAQTVAAAERPTEDELARSCMRLVERIAADAARANRSADLEDLISAAGLGLAHAARSYDPSRGAKFVTLAYVAIRRCVRDAVDSAVRRAKKEARRVDYDLTEAADPHPEPPDQLSLERGECLLWPEAERALAALGDDDAELLDLLGQGLTRPEIGQRLGVGRDELRERVQALRRSLWWAGLGE